MCLKISGMIYCQTLFYSCKFVLRDGRATRMLLLGEQSQAVNTHYSHSPPSGGSSGLVTERVLNNIKLK